MTTYILLIYIYAGVFANGDSVAIHSIDGFNSKEQCMQAGDSASPLVKNSAKEYRFVCIPKQISKK